MVRLAPELSITYDRLFCLGVLGALLTLTVSSALLRLR